MRATSLFLTALFTIPTCLSACSDGNGDCVPQTSKACWPEAGPGGDVRWYDSCGEPGELAADCPDVNSRCVESAAVVTCECLGHWEGDACDVCPDPWDPAQDCDACLGNRDPASDCTTCIGNWNLVTDCSTCLPRWDLVTDCATCLPPWEGDSCELIGGFDLGTCARASACLPEDPPSSFGSNCDSFLVFAAVGEQSRSSEVALSVSLLECITAAADCDAMRECVKASPADAEVCDGAAGEYHCSGDVLVECPTEPGQTPDAFDCAAAGLVCGVNGFRAGCGVAPCDPGTDERYCDGGVLFQCDSAGVWETHDCAFDTAGPCGTNASGDPSCTGDGPACDRSTFDDSCDGSIMVSCRGAREARIDCAQIDPALVCIIHPDWFMATCVFPENECDSQDDETCADGVIRFCQMGRYVDVDCRAYGHSGCETADVYGTNVARCVE